VDINTSEAKETIRSLIANVEGTWYRDTTLRESEEEDPEAMKADSEGNPIPIKKKMYRVPVLRDVVGDEYEEPNKDSIVRKIIESYLHIAYSGLKQTVVLPRKCDRSEIEKIMTKNTDWEDKELLNGMKIIETVETEFAPSIDISLNDHRVTYKIFDYMIILRRV